MDFVIHRLVGGGSQKRKKERSTSLPQETRGTSNKQTNLKQLKQFKKRTTTKKPKVSRENKIMKIREEINDKEIQETIAKFSKTKSWFFEKISKTDKPLARLIKKKREKNQVNKIRNENGEITTDNTEVQTIIKD